MLRVVESTHPLAPGAEWITDARPPFAASAGAVVLRGNPGNERGPFRLVVEVSFHRAGAVRPGTAAPWSSSRVAVTSAMGVFDLDRTGNAGHEQLGVDTRMGSGLSPGTAVEAVDSTEPGVRTWRAAASAPRADSPDTAVLVVFDTSHDVASQPLRLVFDRTGNVGRDIVLGGTTPPLGTDAWTCQ